MEKVHIDGAAKMATGVPLNKEIVSKGEENPFKQKEKTIFDCHIFTWEDQCFESAGLEKAMNFKEPCDSHPEVTVIVDGVRFTCNPLLLQAYSMLFLDLPNEDPNVIMLPDGIISSEKFSTIYDWICAENPEWSRKGLVELYVAATNLQVDQLVEQCETIFQNKNIFFEADAYMLFVEISAYGLSHIQFLLLPRITRFFYTLMSSADFLKMNIDTVCMFLDSDFIGVNTEGDVLMAAILWLTSDWNRRRQHSSKIMACVDFNMVPQSILLHIVSGAPPCDPALQLMQTDTPFVRKVHGGMIFNVFANTQTGLKPNTTQSPGGQLKVRPRIYDEHWNYHFKPNEDQTEITYACFLKLREHIFGAGKRYWESLKMY